MYTVSQIKSLGELGKLWPRLLKMAKAECQHLNTEKFLQVLLKCFGHGAVFVVRGNAGLLGSCAVESTDNFILVLHNIPNDKGTGMAKACLEAVKKYAEDNAFVRVQATTQNFSGASFRYFKKTLGFRYHAATFSMNV
jgi:hypothetical protein